jgi:nicotinamidase-related amidase
LLQFIQADTVFKKDTYSAFKSKQFRDFLKKNSITELTLCGLDTDACILATAYEGFDLGYTIHVLDKLTASHSGEDYEKFGLSIINKNLQKKQKG